MWLGLEELEQREDEKKTRLFDQSAECPVHFWKCTDVCHTKHVVENRPSRKVLKKVLLRNVFIFTFVLGTSLIFVLIVRLLPSPVD